MMMTMVMLFTGTLVCVGPNLRSLYAPDRHEAPWQGMVIRSDQYSVDVWPLNGGLARYVLYDRIQVMKDQISGTDKCDGGAVS